ncbi:hypothetical protein A2230_06370 [candidate division WOR-1 bacterium RIFOXYA2_FULL_36_21]|uniref:DUF86 domain-containing protein n=1 Tax=candidate division WOR-1 bacterium RIFOXYB2_FULL_36_35 TaxID=1802578 RepID=A0A1F4RYZ7_UNCSA|nr:MAG: hypothetical protein A2230_06370 [candidate division WOR-1 bacterium RIFOXYA2_FULL_36_21]OGC13416.1 MAG: hypothetical protein A2290_09005 [candidate division WOR-1 bacterium RIFOXYB2_FULL_36_35]OGC14302.1 MAG: hypothetical protein A2282_00065 [candidate division WOR-1 bacterium RIFOXYA12_FULL_36_13]
MSKRTDALYLDDIINCIRKIEEYTKGLSWDQFFVDEKTVDAVIRNLEIIGEASNNISKELKDKNPNVPWIEIIGMRNKIVHEYFGVDNEILWKTIKEDIERLKIQIQDLK